MNLDGRAAPPAPASYCTWQAYWCYSQGRPLEWTHIVLIEGDPHGKGRESFLFEIVQVRQQGDADCSRDAFCSSCRRRSVSWTNGKLRRKISRITCAPLKGVPSDPWLKMLLTIGCSSRPFPRVDEEDFCPSNQTPILK